MSIGRASSSQHRLANAGMLNPKFIAPWVSPRVYKEVTQHRPTNGLNLDSSASNPNSAATLLIMSEPSPNQPSLSVVLVSTVRNVDLRVSVEEGEEGSPSKKVKLSATVKVMEQEDKTTAEGTTAAKSSQPSPQMNATLQQTSNNKLEPSQKITAMTVLQTTFLWRSRKITPTGLTVPRQIYFIRHGEYNKTSSTQGLTPRGKAQARACGEYFKVAEITPTELLHSQLQRSVETADIIAKYVSMPQKSSHILKEVSITKELQFQVGHRVSITTN